MEANVISKKAAEHHKKASEHHTPHVQRMSMSRLLIGLGLVILLIGIAWPWLSRLGLGRLPGDIVIERENFHFYFPLATSIIVSIILSSVLWLLNR